MKRTEAPIRFATIGTSKITQNFLAAAAKCEEFQLIACYSRSMEKAREFGGRYHALKYYDNLEEMAQDEEIDGVYIASPNSLHHHQALTLLRAGKHVLCEKALASNAREAEEMFQTAQQHQVVLLEAMRPAFDPGMELIAENLPKIGKIRRVNFRYCQYSSRYESYKKGENHNIFDRRFSAGALMDIGIYCMYPLVQLFGRPDGIHAESVFLRDGIDGAGSILAKYDTMLAEVAYSKITNSAIPSEIQGEDGCMVITEIPNPRKIRITYNDGRTEEILPEACDNNMIYELEHFVRMVRGEESAVPYQKISLQTMKLMDEARAQCKIVFPADI